MAVSVLSPPAVAIARGRPDPTLPSLFGDQQELTRVVRRIESLREPVSDPPFLEWLLGDARRIPRDADFFDEMCWRLVGTGLPLSRVNIAMRTLHPEILGFAFRWYRARRVVEVLRVNHAIRDTDEYLKSPIRAVNEDGVTVRFHLEDEASIRDYPLLERLRQDGATEYFALPLTLFSDRKQPMAWTTDRPGGFTDAEIALMESFVPAISTVIEARAMRAIAGGLLEVYLGKTAGRRVLAGEVQRAHGERMQAVILASDMRGFTNLSDRLPGDELIALLDDYFDAIAAPVEARGGEVLKFIGDGVLAIFPVGDASEHLATELAIAAALDALHRVGQLSAARIAGGRSPVRVGIALHRGEIIYGNVGAAERLDFTAIGPAVNLAFRIESLTKRLDRSLLLSPEVARLAVRETFSLGFHPLRGLSEPEEVFGLMEAPFS